MKYKNLSLLASKLLKKGEKYLKEKWIQSRLKENGSNKASRIPTYTTKDELYMLHDLAIACPNKANVVEIGSYLGASTCYLAAGLIGKKASLYCIDTWKNETMPDGRKDTFKEFHDNLLNVETKIIAIRKNSKKVSANELPKKIALAFIDGDHSLSAVINDVQLVLVKMEKRSVIAFHDAIYFKGVSMAIGKILASGKWKIEGQVNNLVWLRQHNFEK